MSIITKAGSPVKGSSTIFTLDKAALAAIASVAADSYFSDSSNWKEVSLVYRAPVGKQSDTLKFDASLASPTANFAVSLKARDVFQIHKIVIKDFDGGTFKVSRSELTTADFDVDLSAIVALISGDFASGLPAGWYNGGATITGGLAKFDNTYAQILKNISGPYVITAGQTYTVRLHIASAPTITSNQQILVNLFGGSQAIFNYGIVSPHIGGYVDLPVTAGPSASGWELNMSGVNCYSGNEINISKIEIF